MLIIFGAGRLPEVFGQLGRGVKTFREEATGEGATTKSASTPIDQPKRG